MNLTQSHSSLTVLVAPLNWGLGHAVRCIPIINHLLSRGINVITASDGHALKLLKAEFPELKHFEMPGYNVVYKRSNMTINLLLQLPQIANAIALEKKWLDGFLQNHQIDAVISDNRFGLYRRDIPTVFISHQICVPIPGKLLYQLGNALNHYYINKYDEVWVPDLKGDFNLSGKMSHNTGLDDKLTYLGPISRMVKKEATKKYDLCVVLSGPEPQRTKLEHLILTQLARLPYRAVVVRGLTGSYQRVKCSERLELVSFMKGEELAEVILSSDIIISRSGYTTLLDLYSLNVKALLIPTPGQKEQEVLAEHFNEEGIFHFVRQDNLVLERDIVEAMSFPGFASTSSPPNVQMHSVVSNWLDKIADGKSPVTEAIS